MNPALAIFDLSGGRSPERRRHAAAQRTDTLQRRYQTAIILVHHARKGAAHLRAGQALRGSSELHAWGDSNLYLRRGCDGDKLSLTIEHRAAASSEGLALQPLASGDGLALQLDSEPRPLPPLSAASGPSSATRPPRSPSKPCAAQPRCAPPPPPDALVPRRSDKGYVIVPR